MNVNVNEAVIMGSLPFTFVSIHGGAVFKRFVRRPIWFEVWHAARDSFLKLSFNPVTGLNSLGIYC